MSSLSSRWAQPSFVGVSDDDAAAASASWSTRSSNSPSAERHRRPAAWAIPPPCPRRLSSVLELLGDLCRRSKSSAFGLPRVEGGRPTTQPIGPTAVGLCWFAHHPIVIHALTHADVMVLAHSSRSSAGSLACCARPQNRGAPSRLPHRIRAQPGDDPQQQTERRDRGEEAAAAWVARGGQLPSGRRLLLGGSLATATALGSNFLGLTSFLLGSLAPSTGRRLRLDVLYAIKGQRRSLDLQNGYTFTYPARYLADQTLLRRYARRIEEANPLDPPPLRRAPRASSSIAEPVAAYGPAGTSGETSISVVVAPIMAGFELESLGSPDQAGGLILSSFIAPPNSGKEGELISARGVRKGGMSYYVIEYRVTSIAKGWTRHNLSVFGSDKGLLYSLNAQCPEKEWGTNKQAFEASVDSFEIVT